MPEVMKVDVHLSILDNALLILMNESVRYYFKFLGKNFT